MSTAEPPAIVPLAPHQGGAEPLSSNEPEAQAKALASTIALTLTTYEAGEGVADIATRLEPAAGAKASGLAGTLHVPGSWSRGRIIYPQLGGLTPGRSSVMVVVEQLVGTPEGVRGEIRTLDIRLARSEGGAWQFEALASAGGQRIVPPGALSHAALSVLNDPRIELPDSARWDIFRGGISSNLLKIMARMAEETDYGVVTLMSGHPREVFGTDRLSDHTRGRAVDVYRLGDRLVIDDRHEGSGTKAFVEWLYDQPEVVRIGSPWALDGFGGRSFTDALHQDHLHIAVVPD
ncbi:hypothetical protein [Pelagibacterium montanilacus]|uniref:hypothetical protein n=1 Tax=Pelagibacterium montanilacus TaxID=2185280 RepID=UPI000F8D4073|nr:hypothetical protein [Pelagibacterium montanilacus]